MFLFWAILGALIGYVASQKRGFSPVGGVLGGLLLGPLAVLMFFISGVASAKDGGKTCPFCAEQVKADAVVCKHCGRDVSPRAMYEARRAKSTARP